MPGVLVLLPVLLDSAPVFPPIHRHQGRSPSKALRPVVVNHVIHRGDAFPWDDGVRATDVASVIIRLEELYGVLLGTTSNIDHHQDLKVRTKSGDTFPASGYDSHKVDVLAVIVM